MLCNLPCEKASLNKLTLIKEQETSHPRVNLKA